MCARFVVGFVLLGAALIDIAFNRSGGIDPRLSDLNANGIADRRD